MSAVLEQYHRAIEYVSGKLALERLQFGIRWDNRIDKRDQEDHNRICRNLIRDFKPQDSYIGYGGLSDNEIDEVVDVCHWEEIT